jgi:hypothetical protein
MRPFSRQFVIAALALAAIAPAAGQTCDTIFGGVTCGAPRGANARPPSSSGSSGGGGQSVQSLGFDLSGSSGGSYGSGPPAMFGSITFGGSGAKCSGLFRTRDCF